MKYLWVFLSFLFVGCGNNGGNHSIVLRDIPPYPAQIWVEESFKPDESGLLLEQWIAGRRQQK